MFEILRKKSTIVFCFLVIIFILPALFGLLHQGFPLTDDGNWMVIRFSSFYENLGAGQFPVRFLTRLNNGYGYPVGDFLYPAFMYIATPMHVLGLNFVDSIKMILTLSLSLGAIFTFLWLKKFFGNLEAFIGSLFYTLSPYHLFDIYKRGSVGEVLSLAVLPFIFWQIERKSFFWTTLGISLLILSHNSLAALFMLLIVSYMALNIFISKSRKNLFIFFALQILIALGISAFFWIPAIVDLKYTAFSSTNVSDWSKYFSDFSLIGFSTLFVVLVTFFLILTKKIPLNKHRLTVLLLVFGLVSIFFATSISAVVWNFLPVSFIQFPFRFLSLTIICISFLASCILSVLPKKIKLLLVVAIFFLIIFDSSKYLYPKSFQYYPDSFYATNQDSTTVKNEYMPKWVRNVPKEMYSAKVENLTGSEKINILSTSGNKTIFQTNLKDAQQIQVNTVYFPGWKAYVNGKEALISYNNDYGVIRLALNKGENNVEVIFGETGLRIFSDLVSVISIMGLFAFYFYNKKNLQK